MYFDSRRSAVLATHGMVATSQPLAAMAGLRALVDGGNAVDAAIAAAATLNVVEPHATGVGGDLFALVWNQGDKTVRALNGSGRAPGGANAGELRALGYGAMPGAGPFSVSVPGTVHGWETLRAECGSMPLGRLLEPAIGYAEEGFPVSEVIAWQWGNSLERLLMYPSGREFLVDGRAPVKGELVRLPTLGATLRGIAEGGCEAFYKGEIAEGMAAFVQEHGGWLSGEDLAGHCSDWEEAIATDYRGVTCWECPPSGQGVAALEALNIVEGFDIKGMGAQSADAYHCLIEAMRLAFADAYRYVADPRVVDVPTGELVSKGYAARRRELIDLGRAMDLAPYGHPFPEGELRGGNTVYVAAVDGAGNACSLINSIFSDFGSGMVVPGTGIVLHNRAGLFSLDESHPNALAGGKRPYHTIIPGMATRDGELLYCFGMMGAFMQPQGHLQLVCNMVDYGMDPQEAVNALRFMVGNGQALVEEGLGAGVVRELQGRGHRLGLIAGRHRVSIGGAQVIGRDVGTGVLVGGTEPRKDGVVVGW